MRGSAKSSKLPKAQKKKVEEEPAPTSEEDVATSDDRSTVPLRLRWPFWRREVEGNGDPCTEVYMEVGLGVCVSPALSPWRRGLRRVE